MKRERIPGWVVWATLIGLLANLLAIATTFLTIGAMGGVSEYARAVRELDVHILRYYRPIAIVVVLGVVIRYLWPVIRYFRDEAPVAPSAIVQRRTLGAPLFVAGVGFLGWLAGMVIAPVATILRFGHWSTELMSQHILAPLVNSFLAATTTYLLLDWLFRSRVIPQVFPEGRIEVAGSLTVGVRARLLITLVAVAFLPLFTMLGLVRSAAVRFESGMPVGQVMPALATASETTFAVYVVLGVGLTLVLARSLTGRLGNVAAGLRRVQGGDLDVRIQVTSQDEVGVVEAGLNTTIANLRENERILKTFGRVVEPAVRDHLLSGEVRLGGEVRTATILFCDLRGFTAMSERTTPAEVVVTLNEFFTRVTTWVRSCGGFVDKFIGDSLLVVFGLFPGPSSPGPAEGAAAALHCALGIHDRLAELNTIRAEAGKPPLAVSIGIHTGEVLAGTIGAEDRHEYTVIGDTVNVAARLQQACKERKCLLLASEATHDLARSSGFAGELDPLEAVALRGRSEHVRIVGKA